MKTLILLAGAAALGFASPAIAKPGNGHGKSHKGHKGQSALLHGEHGKGSLYGKGIGGCPPGHAKHPGVCMPHGQFKKLFNVGQRVPLGYRGLLGYDGLPYDLRNRYGAGLDPYSRYIYQDDYLYRVDPKTMIVSQILRAIL
jgi:hypothetical protein